MQEFSTIYSTCPMNIFRIFHRTYMSQYTNKVFENACINYTTYIMVWTAGVSVLAGRMVEQ